MSYPTSASRGPLMDIHVFREDDGGTIALTNTTAREVGPSRLWLNGWFSREIPGLAVGETIRLEVSSFIDEHGKAMRGGGFFATRAGEKAVLAEIEAEGVIYPIVAIPPLDR